MPAQPDFDCLIIGGGLVGATLACALGDSGLRIGVVEAVPFQADQLQPAYDERGLSLAPSSRRILQTLGLWDKVSDFACPIKHIHVSEKGGFGFVRFSAEQEQVDALGHIVLGRALGKVVVESAMARPGVEWISPAAFKGMTQANNSVTASVEIDNDVRELSTRLLIVSDGAQSLARDALGIETENKDYGQTAVVATVTPVRSHGNTAFERFTPDGPMALLPLDAERCVMVWSMRREEVDGVMAMDDEAYRQAMENRFGRRLGGFSRVGKRHAFPLKLVVARSLHGPNYLVIGNAAHAIHPNAAQGLNLGLRDVARVADYISQTEAEGRDIGDAGCLRVLAREMSVDHKRIIRFSDGLTQVFYNDLMPMAALRNSGMLLLDRLPFAKSCMARMAMGLIGPSPSLVRGLRP